MLLAAGALSGCDPGYKFATNAPGSTSGVIGTVATTTTTVAPDEPPCAARQLRAQAGSRENAAVGGGAIGDVIFTNDSGSACQMEGMPAISLFETSGRRLDVRSGSPLNKARPGVVVGANNETTAELVFTWQNWCAQAPGALVMKVQLADGGGSVSAPVTGHLGSAVPTCSLPDQPSILRVQYAYVSSGARSISSA